jgi:hypothetical protein
MKWTGSLVTALAVLALGFLAAPAQAAPAIGLAGDLKSVAGAGSDVQQVRHRCYWYRGHWRCPRHRYRGYYYTPGINFYFGPRRHYHRRWRYRRHRW